MLCIIFLFSASIISPSFSCKKTLVPHLRRKYDREFNAHFANPINEIIYGNLHTTTRTLARDLEFLAEEEWMFGLVEQGLALRIVAVSAQTFEAEREGQLPIILHTKTREIVERRRKKMKKLFQERTVSRTTSESQETVDFLGKALQNFTFQNVESSESQSIYGASFCDVYTISVESESFLQLNFHKQQSHVQLKLIVEQTLRHLILDFQSKVDQISPKIRKKTDVWSGDSSTSQALDSVSSLGSEIETVVRQQLKKYKIGQFYGRNSMSSQRSTVRDKAELLLKNIRRQILE